MIELVKFQHRRLWVTKVTLSPDGRMHARHFGNPFAAMLRLERRYPPIAATPGLA
jgi:hypothetical protein